MLVLIFLIIKFSDKFFFDFFTAGYFVFRCVVQILLSWHVFNSKLVLFFSIDQVFLTISAFFLVLSLKWCKLPFRICVIF